MNLPEATYILASRSVAGGFSNADEHDWFGDIGDRNLRRVRERTLRLRMELDPDDAVYNEAYEFLRKVQ